MVKVKYFILLHVNYEDSTHTNHDGIRPAAFRVDSQYEI
jgi:hypothetical protein